MGLKDYNFLNTFTASKSPGDFEKNADSHSARWSWWLRLFELPREAEAPGPRTTFGETRFLSVIRRLIFYRLVGNHWRILSRKASTTLRMFSQDYSGYNVENGLEKAEWKLEAK